MSSALQALRAHYQQRDQAARAWRSNGGRVVGYLCDNVPEELIMAAGFMPYRLSGDPHTGRSAVCTAQPFRLLDVHITADAALQLRPGTDGVAMRDRRMFHHCSQVR